MRNSVIAGKYAKALFDASLEEGRTDKVSADIDALSGLHQEDEAFLNFLLSPEVLTESKMEFIAKVFQSRMDPLSTNFLRLLVDKGRINLLPEACEAYRELAEEHRGVLRARVVTAVALDGEREARLKRELDRITGKSVILDKKVDPSILGGVVVHMGNKIIDSSLKQGLKRLGESLLHAEVN